MESIDIEVSKRDTDHVRTTIREWESSDQMIMIRMKVLDSDASNKIIDLNKEKDNTS